MSAQTDRPRDEDTMNNPHAHADELAVAMLRLGSLRATLTDFTESLTGSDHLWDHLDPMTKSRAIQLHDIVILVGDDLDLIRSLMRHPAGLAQDDVARRLFEDVDCRDEFGDECCYCRDDAAPHGAAADAQDDVEDFT